MAVLSVANSHPALLEQLLGSSTDTTVPKIKGFFRVQATSANPTDTTALANASVLVTAAVTVTGVAVGDEVIACSPVSGLAANQLLVNAYVSATDTVTLVIGNVVNTTVTTTAVVVNLIVADVT